MLDSKAFRSKLPSEVDILMTFNHNNEWKRLRKVEKTGRYLLVRQY